jgi:hypothetical protein
MYWERTLAFAGAAKHKALESCKPSSPAIQLMIICNLVHANSKQLNSVSARDGNFFYSTRLHACMHVRMHAVGKVGVHSLLRSAIAIRKAPRRRL